MNFIEYENEFRSFILWKTNVTYARARPLGKVNTNIQGGISVCFDILCLLGCGGTESTASLNFYSINCLSCLAICWHCSIWCVQ